MYIIAIPLFVSNNTFTPRSIMLHPEHHNYQNYVEINTNTNHKPPAPAILETILFCWNYYSQILHLWSRQHTTTIFESHYHFPSTITSLMPTNNIFFLHQLSWLHSPSLTYIFILRIKILIADLIPIKQSTFKTIS